MTLRGAVFYLYLLSFLIGLIGTLMMPGAYWKLLVETQPWQIALHAYLLIMAFCGILVAYWVAHDDIDIYDLQNEIRDLKKRLKKKSS